MQGESNGHSGKRIFIIGGEASGDLHGSNLARALKQQSPGLELAGWGGDLMSAQGVRILKHYRELAFMGFIEVLMNIRTIMKNFRLCKDMITSFKPDAIVMIDYPGFNLRMAKWAFEQGIPVHYYISPQIWAWKENRVHDIRKYVTRMYVVLPFEKSFYAKHEYDVDFVGHPLLDVVSGFESHSRESFLSRHHLADKPILALIPGSRKQEIQVMMPLMLEAAERFPDYQIVLTAAPSQDISFYQSLTGRHQVKIISGDTYGVMKHASAGFVTSGTATLEAALFGLPQVVCYKGSAISYYIARKLIKVKYISLVNLIADREVVKELIQHHLNCNEMSDEMNKLLNDQNYRSTMLRSYEQLREQLGGQGASERTAKLMLKSICGG
jgi:lipid-A-disaccharide synthase